MDAEILSLIASALVIREGVSQDWANREAVRLLERWRNENRRELTPPARICRTCGEPTPIVRAD
jgi:hypothetical protein